MKLDQKSFKKLLKRFDDAPLKIQKSASRSMVRAGANVIKQHAKAKAPAYLKKTIKVIARRNRSGNPLESKVSVIVGGSSLRDKSEIAKDARAMGLKTSKFYLAFWVEFGTYGNRDYSGEEPYSPRTLQSPSYASGRSNSKAWNVPSVWIPASPFMRPAINDHIDEVEKAMASKLDAYLSKKGL